VREGIREIGFGCDDSRQSYALGQGITIRASTGQAGSSAVSSGVSEDARQDALDDAVLAGKDAT
jgi:hypothetical protein